jgi:PST family polysaccharide transporter
VAAVVVLARLLTPADFGLLAMVVPVTILANSLANVGLHGATLHTDSLDQERLSALWWISLRMNGVVFGAMALSGPVLAWLYRDSRVAPIAALWAVALYGVSTSGLHEAFLKRQLRFGAVATIQTSTQALGIAAAILAALLGAGYWALVIRYAIADLTRGASSWVVSRWRPSLHVHLDADARADVRAMQAYGAGWTGYRLVTWLGQQVDRVVVGSLAGPGVLGLYHNARRWAFFPSFEVFASLSDVAVSALSRLRGDPSRFRQYFRRGIIPVLVIPLPVIAFVFVDAREVIQVLLGDQWLAAVPFLRWMSLAAFMTCISQLSNWIYLAEGTTRRQFQWAVIRTPVMLAGVAVGSWWGAHGIAAGFAVATVLLTYPALAYCLRGSRVSMADIAEVAVRPVAATLVAACGLAACVQVLPSPGSPLVAMSMKLGTFALMYAGTWILLPGGRRALREVAAHIGSVGARVGCSSRKR